MFEANIIGVENFVTLSLLKLTLVAEDQTMLGMIFECSRCLTLPAAGVAGNTAGNGRWNNA